MRSVACNNRSTRAFWGVFIPINLPACAVCHANLTNSSLRILAPFVSSQAFVPWFRSFAHTLRGLNFTCWLTRPLSLEPLSFGIIPFCLSSPSQPAGWLARTTPSSRKQYYSKTSAAPASERKEGGNCFPANVKQGWIWKKGV